MLRKMRDSNPRYPKEGIPDFESSAFGHSANLPVVSKSNAKIVFFDVIAKFMTYFLTILTSVSLLFIQWTSSIGVLDHIVKDEGVVFFGDTVAI